MGIFDIFKSKPKFKDELFGEMEYSTFKDPKKNFYDGKANFNSLDIGINIDADENGPTKEQRDFFLNLRDNYTTIQKNIIEPFLKKEFEDWIDENKIKDLDKEFIIDGISIPRLPAIPVIWTITYYAIKIEHWVTIDFKDFEPQGTCVDG